MSAPETTWPPAPAETVVDERAFDDFYRRERVKLLRLAYVLTGSRAVAEELVQEAMLRVLRHWGRLAVLEQPGAWARRILINLATSRGRRLACETRAFVRLGRNRPPEPTPTPDSAAVWDAVRRLSRREAQVIALYYLEDMSVAEICAVLEMPEGTVKSLMRRARIHLAELLGEDPQ